MPTYDYICRACGHALELFQAITENPKRKCPECGRLKLERQIGAGAGFIFKGTGFYQTDYRSESYNTAAKADSAESAPDKPDKQDKKDKQTDSGAAADSTKPKPAKKSEASGDKSGPKPEKS